MRKTLLVINILLISTINLCMGQQMYRWKDANGQFHYTDNEAEAAQKKATTLDRPIPQTVSTTTTLSSEQIEARRMQEAQQAQQKAQMAAQFERLKVVCDKRKAYITSLKNWGRITVPDPTQKEGFRFLTDKEVKANIANEEADYNNKCRGL